VSEQNVGVVRDAIAAFNRGGVEEALAYLDPNIEWLGPPEWLEERLYVGHSGMRRLALIWTESFDEYRLDLERVIELDDNRVVVLLYQRGRIKGSASRIEQPIGYDWEIRDGKVSRAHIYFSWDAVLKAVGLED
jgi:ketosteroid isomerase-like protein